MRKKKKANGRPTKFKKKYCQMLIDHMHDGYSFRSFAGVVGVNFDTVYHWCTIHPSFSDARKIGEAKNLYTYEQLIWEAARGERNINLGAAVWFGKNVLKWTDKVEVVDDEPENPYPDPLDDDEE